MLFSRFFKQPKPNKFVYTPMYYDSKKEARNQRETLIKKELGLSDNNNKEFDSESFRERFSSQMGSSRRAKPKSMFSSFKGSTSKSTTRLLILVIIAGVILYWQLKG